MASRNNRNVPAKGLVASFFSPEMRAWRGEEALWKVFWGYGVAVSSGIAGVYALAIHSGHLGAQQVLLVVSAAYSAWILVSVWRCAGNTRERLFGLFARLLTVAWAGNVIMLLTFLQFDLIVKYLRP